MLFNYKLTKATKYWRKL